MSDESAQIHAGDLIKSISIENLVNQRASVLERIARALEILREADELAAAAGVGFPTFCLSTGYSRQIDHRLTGRYRDDDADRFLEVARIAIDIGGWQHLMEQSGLRSLMDAKARKEWDEQFDRGYGAKPIPELTLENIRSTFASLHVSRGDMFERGILNIFKSLSWDYKTNRPFKFGKRIILRSLRYSITGGSGYGYLNSRVCDELDDLTRVFSILDGKPEPDHRDSIWAQISRHERAEFKVTAENQLETPYFDLKWFRNGNGHLAFKRADLVERMNAILAKHYPGALAHDRQSA